MKTRAFLALAFGVFLSASAFAGPFETANEKYRAGDFKAAAQGYEQILKTGEGTAAVQYNLGNALLRLGKKAQALVAYQRALKADPRNRDLRWNIGIVESLVTDRQENNPAAWLETLRRGAGWVSPDETAMLILAIGGLLALLGWIQFASRGRFARLVAVQGVLFTAALVLALFFTFQLRTERRAHAVVLEKDVTLRYGPAFSETKAFVLHEGALVDVLDESGDWLYVSFGKNAGWLPKKTSEIV